MKAKKATTKKAVKKSKPLFTAEHKKHTPKNQKTQKDYLVITSTGDLGACWINVKMAHLLSIPGVMAEVKAFASKHRPETKAKPKASDDQIKSIAKMVLDMMTSHE